MRENTFKEIFDKTKDIVILTDKNLKIIDGNHFARKYCEWKPNLCVGDLYPDKGKLLENDIASLISGEKESLSLTMFILPRKEMSVKLYAILDHDNIILIHRAKGGNIKETHHNDNVSPMEVISLDNKLGDVFKKANEKLLLYERLFSLMPVLAAIIDFGGYIKLLNPAWEKILGYSVDELQARPFYENIHPSDYEFTMDNLEKVKNNHVTIHSVINRFRCKDGSYKWLSWSIGADNKNKLYYIAAFDVTDKKLADERLQKSKDLLNLTGNIAMVGGWEFEVENMCMTWTDQMYRIHDMKTKEPLNLNDEVECFKGDASIEFQSALDKALNLGEPWDMVLPFRSKKGKEIWVRTLGKLDMIDGIVCKIFGAIQDVTENKKMEETLKLSVQEAQIANITKTEFLANISHEIRTPITAILGYTDLLSNLVETDRKKKYVESIKVAGKNLLRLMEDLLDMTAMESGKLKIHYEMLNVQDIFEEIRTFFERKLEEKGIVLILKLDNDVPDRVLLDEIRLRQILLNLTSNAVKFTDSGSISIRAAFKPTSSNHGNLTIEVEDTGIGIPGDQYNLIFEAFKQMEGQSSRKYGGAGLGLSITKHLVHMMNGEVSIKSVDGVGSCFTLVFNDVNIENDQRRKVKIDQKTGDLPDAEKSKNEANNINVCDGNLIKIFKEEFLVRYNKLKTVFIIENIKKFAMDLKEYSTVCEIDKLNDFCDRLMDAANLYNIRESRAILEEFPKIVEELTGTYRD